MKEGPCIPIHLLKYIVLLHTLSELAPVLEGNEGFLLRVLIRTKMCTHVHPDLKLYKTRSRHAGYETSQSPLGLSQAPPPIPHDITA